MSIHLPISRFRIQFEKPQKASLPRYAGSAWRGALGHALKRTVCVVKDTPCPACMLYRTCAYPYIFETPPAQNTEKMRRYEAAPHPFVLGMNDQGDATTYSLGLTLVGRGHQFLPYLLHAMERAGEHGIGKSRQPFSLIQVQQQTGTSDKPSWHSIYAPGQTLNPAPAITPDIPQRPSLIQINLLTPMRLKRKEHLVTPNNFQFGDLFSALLRRISMLSYFHTEQPLETEFAALARYADTVEIRNPRLSWYDWTRYSSRQQTDMQMGGILGSFWVDGHLIDELWPYLWLGQWIHVGKGATMGLGQFTLDLAPTPERQATQHVSAKIPAI